MAIPSGADSAFQGHYPDQHNPYGDYSQWVAEPQSGAKPTHRHLTTAVAVLGLGSYLVSFGPMLNISGIDWDVRLPVLAGLLAAFGLLPRQTPATKVFAALAALGFLDALSRVIVVPDGIEPGWALWVIVVLNGLQAAAAVGALLNQPSATDDQQAWYAAYAEQYAQAAAQYYGQYGQETEPETGYDSRTGRAQQAQEATASEPRRAVAPQQASYAEFIGDPAATPTGQVSGAAGAPHSQGLPSVGHSQAPIGGPAQQTAAGEPEYRTSN